MLNIKLFYICMLKMRICEYQVFSLKTEKVKGFCEHPKTNKINVNLYCAFQHYACK